MKKNSIIKVILLVLLVVCACTWIFPTLEFQQQLIDGERSQVGVFDVFAYLTEAIQCFPYVILMTLSIGAFYGVAYRISAYRELLDRIVTRFKGKEFIFLVATIVLISGVVSITGLTYGMLFVFPFIISVVLLMGYNKLVAATVTVGSLAVGILGTTLATSTTRYINYFLQTTYKSEIVTKIILLVIGIVVLAYNVISYAKKTKNDTDKVLDCVPLRKEDVVKEEIVKDTKEEKSKKKLLPIKKLGKNKANNATKKDVKVVKKQKKVKILPFVLIFDLVFIAIVAFTFDWSGILSSNWQSQTMTAIRDFSIKGFNIFSKILGSSFRQQTGAWNMNFELPGLILIATVLVAFIYGVKFNKFLEGFLDGIRRASKPVFYMLITYVVLIIVVYHPFQLHITKFFLELTSGLNVITMTLIVMVSSIFNIEAIYVAQSSLPYITSVITDTSLYPIIAVIYQAVYGLMILVAPTSVLLLGTLVYLDIPYTQWLKYVWKLFLELLLILVVVFLVLVLI